MIPAEREPYCKVTLTYFIITTTPQASLPLHHPPHPDPTPTMATSTSTSTSTTTPLIIDQTTILSLLLTLLLLLTAHLTSHRLLPAATTSTKQRILYTWHIFDGLTHLLLEGSFLYNCFFTYTDLAAPSSSSSDYPHPASILRSNAHNANAGHFLAHPDRAYGSAHGTNAAARLWQEYARADARWGVADATVVSLELLTVFVAGPLAVYVCALIRRACKARDAGRGGKGEEGKLWFWATVLATGELYGGFMTFAPEWLSGCPSLDTGNWLYL